MTMSGAPGQPGPGAERYPGEALDLLRAIHAGMAEIVELRREFGPLLDSVRDGRGLLGMAQAARRVRNGEPGDYPPSPPGGGPPASVGPGLWGRIGSRRGVPPGPGDPPA